MNTDAGGVRVQIPTETMEHEFTAQRRMGIAAERERLRGLAERAADMLTAYGELIRRDGASHVEEHHYLPEVEHTARELRECAAGPTSRPPTPVGWSDTDWLRHLGTCPPIGYAVRDSLYGTSKAGVLRFCSRDEAGAFAVYASPRPTQTEPSPSTPPQVPVPLTEFKRMQIIGDEFPLALVQPIVIAKVDSVCIAIEKAHGIGV